MEQGIRQNWVDVLKAISIYFVILGHNAYLGENFRTYVYSFHMPLFFLIAGLFFKVHSLNYDLAAFIKEKLNTRIVPYFFLGLLTYIAWMVMLLAKEYGLYEGIQINTNPLKPLCGMSLFLRNAEEGWLAHNQALWFLPCLFATETLFFVAKVKMCHNRYLLALMLLFSVIGYYLSNHVSNFPFSLDVAFTSVTFYGLGYLCRKFLIERELPLWAFCIFVLAGWYISFINGRVNMAGPNYQNYFLFYSSAICGCLSYFQLAQNLSHSQIFNNKLIRYLGQNTLLIFTLQPIAGIIIGGLIRLLQLKVYLLSGTVFAVTHSIFEIIAIIPMLLVFNRYFPNLVGKTKRNMKSLLAPEQLRAL